MACSRKRGRPPPRPVDWVISRWRGFQRVRLKNLLAIAARAGAFYFILRSLPT